MSAVLSRFNFIQTITPLSFVKSLRCSASGTIVRLVVQFVVWARTYVEYPVCQGKDHGSVIFEYNPLNFNFITKGLVFYFLMCY